MGATVQAIFGFNKYVHETTLNSVGQPRLATLNPYYRDSPLPEAARCDESIALYQFGSIYGDCDDATEFAGAAQKGDFEPKSDDADTLALQALNRKLHQDTRVDMVLLPFSDGLTLARKR